MERTLLIVDDEENIRRALQRLFSSDGYRIYTAGGGREALTILTSSSVGVILSDQRMPEMSGIEFLMKVKELYPDTIRLVLSGYTELKMITDAINEGAIYKFLTKPWEDDLLRKNIAQAFQQYELAGENGRLSNELKKLNQELFEANKVLETQAQRRTRYSDINLRTLHITQEVLENLPMAVVGVGADRIIAVANLKAHNLLMPGSGGIVGLNVLEVLPDISREIWDSPMDAKFEVLIEKQVYEIQVSSLNQGLTVGVKSMVVLPKKY